LTKPDTRGAESSLIGEARPVTACRSCHSGRLVTVLDLGSTPVANALVDPARSSTPEPAFPLEIRLCLDCGLVQIAHELPPDVLFAPGYPYFASYSDTVVQHAAKHVQGLIEARLLGAESFVVELASNDGYLLKHFVAAQVPVLGIDPAPGPVLAARAAGVPSLQAFFGAKVARDVRARRGPADVIIANNVLAHVPDPNDFVAGIDELLAPDGVVTIENPWVKDLVERLEFDTVYHEHYSYLSCLAVSALFRRAGLFVNHVEYFENLHGGSLRWWLSREERISAAAAEALAAERRLGVSAPAFYAAFAKEVEEAQASLVGLLRSLRAEDKRVAAYGATAKGATLLNSAGVDASLIEFVVDKNEGKCGKLIPGCRIPVRPISALLQEQPDYTLLLAWNLEQEVLGQEAEYQRRGGRFIAPVDRHTRRAAILVPRDQAPGRWNART
jgi:SAM-dependent methyltransferase